MIRYFLLLPLVFGAHLRSVNNDTLVNCVRECFGGSFPLYKVCSDDLDSEKFHAFINCWIQPWYFNIEDPASLAENSRLPLLFTTSVNYCKTTYGGKFCRWEGTNYLHEESSQPVYYYNCGTKTCDGFVVPHDPYQKTCIKNLYSLEG
jgi:hypothetical protein